MTLSRNKSLNEPPQTQLLFGEHLDNFPKISVDTNKVSRFKKWGAYIALMLGCVFLGSISYDAFRYSTIPETLSAIPLVAADHAPVRIVPQDPGGALIENQDKMIYRSMTDDSVVVKRKDADYIEPVISNSKSPLRNPPKPKEVKKPKADETKDAKKSAKVEGIKNSKPQAKSKTPPASPFDLIKESE